MANGPSAFSGRVGILSNVLPPLPAGSAVRIARLLDGLDRSSYRLIVAGCRYGAEDEDGHEGLRLHNEWRRVSVPSRGPCRPMLYRMDSWLRILQRTRNLSRVIRNENLALVVAFSADTLNLPSASLACRATGCRLVAAIDDDYVQSRTDATERRLAGRLERGFMGRVSLILAISDFCRDEYRRRYPTIRSLVLYNPVPHAAPPDPNSVAVSPRGAVARLVFAGSVYGANAHALLCVNQALNVSKGTRACLEIYTAQAESTVRDFGFGKNVHIMKSRPQTEIARAISGADIALLPMGIESPFPEVIRTSSPMKLADYCVSLRPILACVPEDSFAAWYLKKHDAAWVESTGRPESIAATIQAILSDADGRRRKVANALACARRDFSAEVLQRRLVESINKVLEDHAA